MSTTEENKVAVPPFDALSTWKTMCNISYDVKLDSDTPCIMKSQGELESWELMEKDCKDYQDWLPLVCYSNGIRFAILYRNIKVGDAAYGNFKLMTVFCGPGDHVLVDMTNEEGVKKYETLVQGARLYEA
jgi:hypothetical protein